MKHPHLCDCKEGSANAALGKARSQWMTLHKSRKEAAARTHHVASSTQCTVTGGWGEGCLHGDGEQQRSQSSITTDKHWVGSPASALPAPSQSPPSAATPAAPPHPASCPAAGGAPGPPQHSPAGDVSQLSHFLLEVPTGRPDSPPLSFPHGLPRSPGSHPRGLGPPAATAARW